MAYESKLEDHNTSIVINVRDNGVNSSSSANNVVSFSNTVSSNGISVNMSHSDFGNLNSSNCCFVGRNTGEFSYFSFAGLAGNFGNMNANNQQLSSHLAQNVGFLHLELDMVFLLIISKILVKEIEKVEVLVEVMVMVLVLMSLVKVKNNSWPSYPLFGRMRHTTAVCYYCYEQPF